MLEKDLLSFSRGEPDFTASNTQTTMVRAEDADADEDASSSSSRTPSPIPASLPPGRRRRLRMLKDLKSEKIIAAPTERNKQRRTPSPVPASLPPGPPHHPRMLKGLQANHVIATPTKHDSKRRSAAKRNAADGLLSPPTKRRITRSEISGEKKVDYDMKYHPMDATTRPSSVTKRVTSTSSGNNIPIRSLAKKDTKDATISDKNVGHQQRSAGNEVEHDSDRDDSKNPFEQALGITWTDLPRFDQYVYNLQMGAPLRGSTLPYTWPAVVAKLVKEKYLTRKQLEAWGGTEALRQRYECVRIHLQEWFGAADEPLTRQDLMKQAKKMEGFEVYTINKVTNENRQALKKPVESEAVADNSASFPHSMEPLVREWTDFLAHCELGELQGGHSGQPGVTDLTLTNRSGVSNGGPEITFTAPIARMTEGFPTEILRPSHREATLQSTEISALHRDLDAEYTEPHLEGKAAATASDDVMTTQGSTTKVVAYLREEQPKSKKTARSPSKDAGFEIFEDTSEPVLGSVGEAISQIRQSIEYNEINQENVDDESDGAVYSDDPVLDPPRNIGWSVSPSFTERETSSTPMASAFMQSPLFGPDAPVLVATAASALSHHSDSTPNEDAMADDGTMPLQENLRRGRLNRPAAGDFF